MANKKVQITNQHNIERNKNQFVLQLLQAKNCRMDSRAFHNVCTYLKVYSGGGELDIWKEKGEREKKKMTEKS